MNAWHVQNDTWYAELRAKGPVRQLLRPPAVRVHSCKRIFRDELLKNKSDKSVQWTVQWVDGIDGLRMLAREVELSIQFYVPACRWDTASQTSSLRDMRDSRKGDWRTLCWL